MSITTLDGALAGMQVPVDFLKVGATMEAAGVMYSTFYLAGQPGAAVASTAGVNGEALTTYLGQLTFNNPVSGNSYLARLVSTPSTAGAVVLADRLWHNSGLVVTTTTEQAITTPAWPARDRTGTTNGDGVMVGIEVTGATTNAGAITTMTLRYNNQNNVEHTATIASFPATAVAGSIIPFQLAAGDTGVRSIAGITLATSLVSGSISLVAYRVLTRVDCMIAYQTASVDSLTGGFVRMYNNTVPFLMFIPSVTTATTISGQMIVTQG